MIFAFFDTNSPLRPLEEWGGGDEDGKRQQASGSVAWRILVGELNWGVSFLNFEKTMKQVNKI